MSDHCNIPHPLKREGVYQWERMPAGLKQGFYKPDDRSIEQLVMQAAEYAAFVKYYDTTLNEWGNWREFYYFIYDYENNKLKFQNIESLLKRADLPPHLGLLLSFLKIFQTTRDQFNGFTNRHVDFYYEDVLRLKKKNAVPDKVAVLFQPEKNTVQAKVVEGRELNAGKDATGKDLVYKTLREIIVNQVSIAQKKTIYAAKSNSGQVMGLHMAKDAATENSFVQNSVTSWLPFGSDENSLAEIGFAFSSPMLFAKEGRRRLTLEIEGGSLLPRGSLTAFYTGPKGWVEAEVDLNPGASNSDTTAKKFLLVKINESLPAVAAYDEKTHKSNFSSTYPVIKFTLTNDENFSKGYEFFSTLKFSGIKKVVMTVDGAKSFTVTGENGKLNPLQAFKPFGNNPVKNKSFFIIGSKEAFNKYLKTFHLAMNWKGAPGNMAKYYKAYNDYLVNIAAKDPSSSISAQTIASFNSQWANFNQGNVPGKMEILNGGKWKIISEDIPNQYASRNPLTYNTYHVTSQNKISDAFDITNNNDFNEASRWGFAKVTLQYNFGHAIFPLVLSTNISTNAIKGNTSLPIPAQPYTPELNSLHLDYVLEDSMDITHKTEHQFIQLHPFGFENITKADRFVIAPDYNFNGQLYLGLSGCTVPQTINLHFARLDGSEDIEALINEKVEWYYLAGSDWKKFGFEQITVNTTQHFAAGGFISFAIPSEAIVANSLMGENLVWIKLVSATSVPAYPSVIDINTNAVEASFDDRDNDSYHLGSPLKANSISKPVIKIEGVKSVSQPYASYDGAMAEQPDNYYTRISERLRHKSRNWSIWDYEHIVLEKFPSIYKLKCISHAQQNEMYQPGYVLCVALPSVTNIADKDLLQPRISKATLTEAEGYAKQFMTTFARVRFINPVYEPIKIKCSVKIRAGFDESYYKTQLNNDLKQFLAPWMTNKNVAPSFEGTIYASSIINFIEERPYVDYLTDFKAFKIKNGKPINWEESTTGSNEDVILTSDIQHDIDTNALC